MNNGFLDIGSPTWDWIAISASFLLVIAIFFSPNGKKHVWLKFTLLATLVLQCALILFHPGLAIKLFAAVVLTITLIIGAVDIRRKKLEATGGQAAK